MRPIAIINNQNKGSERAKDLARTIAQKMEFVLEDIDSEILPTISEWVETHDAALVVCGIDEKTKIQQYLDYFRDLRVPYIFVKEGMPLGISKIAVPVTRFEEDKEKGPYCGSFARNFGSDVTFYQPNDYGSMAQKNIESMTELMKKEGVAYKIEKGKKNSDGIEREALGVDADFLIIGASRDYGWDDIIFGPKERKTIMKSSVPVMVINPRGDLYPLCN